MNPGAEMLALPWREAEGNVPFLRVRFVMDRGDGSAPELLHTAYVPTRAVALRILDAWRRDRRAAEREAAAEARLFNGAWRWPDNRGSKLSRNVTFKRMRKLWSADRRAMAAYCRAHRLSKKAGVDADVYGPDGATVQNSLWDELCECLRERLRRYAAEPERRECVHCDAWNGERRETRLTFEPA